MRYARPLSAKYEISSARYAELRAFCLQHREKVARLEGCYDISAQRASERVHSSNTSDPTFRNAERAMRLRKDIELVEQTAMEAGGSVWEYILLAVTEGVSYDMLTIGGQRCPCGYRQFYEARRRFFWLLDKKK